MSRIVITGAGAFGTALALTLSRAGHDVVLCGRRIDRLRSTRSHPSLPVVEIPPSIDLTETPQAGPSDLLLITVPMQALSGYLKEHRDALEPKAAIACCKGVDLETLRGPTQIIEETLSVPTAILTGPSFAADIARGLPTALTLGCAEKELGRELQRVLSGDTLRIYGSDDPRGAELGGALKNVVAIGCGLCIGAGLGESARAALITRGYAEIATMAVALGGRAQTIAGLSGFGDLVLTCTSEMSRNFSYGLSVARKKPMAKTTIEGRATARAVVELADRLDIDMPIAKAVAGVIEGDITLDQALAELLSRPLKQE